MNFFNQWIDRQKSHARAERTRLLLAEFSVNELNGELYLIHCGVAVRKMPADTTAQEVVKMLEETRNVAVSYDTQKYQEP